MIKEASRSEKSEILNLWKHAYPSQHEDYLKFYFDQIFDEGRCILSQQDNRIVSSLQMNTHTMYFLGKQLKVNYITGVSTLPDYRRRGHMRQLMNSAIDEASHNYLVTLIMGFNPKVYEEFGYEVVYYRKAYTIQSEYLNKVTTAHVSYQASAEELLKVYQMFAQHFDGYYIRDKKYYTLLLKELELQHKELIVCRNMRQEVCGYLVCQKKKNDVMIEEAIYLQSSVLMRMMKKAIGMEKEITIHVSPSERLEKIFPLAIPKKQPYMMARINHLPLFNKLYNTHVKSTKEAFRKVKKPLWCHEYY